MEGNAVDTEEPRSHNQNSGFLNKNRALLRLEGNYLKVHTIRDLHVIFSGGGLNDLKGDGGAGNGI
jgi:hypothetical protein